MDQALVTVIGMTIAYAASFLGMGLAWYSWRRHHEPRTEAEERRHAGGGEP